MAAPSGGFTGVSRSPGSQAGDERMRAVHEEHGEMLLRFLLRLAHGDREVAEDNFQETMLRAWKNVDMLPDQPSSLLRWLYTVARNVAIDAARIRQARPAEVHVTDMSRLCAPEDQFERMTVVLTVRSALAKITTDHRNVLVETYFHERSTADTARSLGIPVGTVKSRAFYALRALHAAMGRRADG